MSRLLSVSRGVFPLSAAVLFASNAAAQTVQSDPAGSGPLLGALQWVEGTLLGNLATTAAVIAVAVVGLMMLTGRIEWRRGVTVVVGAFIVFGAVAIVAGMRSMATGGCASALTTPLASDPVCTALTRPQMFAGVTYSYAVFNLIVTVEAFLISKSFWSLLIAPVIHAVGYFGCLHEPRFFDLWIVRASRCPRVRNHRFWRANSYRP